MNAPALNPAATPPAGSVGSTGTANVAGQAGGALAGFEALLSALFPQGAAVGTTAVVTPPDTASADDAPDPTVDDPLLAAPGTDAAPLSGDANATLLAATLSPQPLIIAALAQPQSNAGTTDLSGSKGKSIAAVPVPFLTYPKTGVDETAEVADAGLPQDPGRLGDASTVTPRRADAGLALPASTQGSRSAPPPSLANPTDATAAAQVPSPSEPVTVEGGPVPVATTPATLVPPASGLEVRQDPAPAPPVRAARSDRTRAGTDVKPPGDPTPAQASDGITTASIFKPVTAVGRAPDTGPEGSEAATRETEIAADAPDATLQSETRAAAQTLTPVAHGAQAVRGSPETVATLAAQIIKKLEGQSTRFDVELNPAGLGKVDVRIDIGAHGRISAAMMFDNPGAAADLRARANELQKMLEQAGFDMSGGMSFDVAGDRGRQQQQTWQDQNDNAGQAFRGQAFRAALDTAGAATDAAVNGALRLRRGVNAGLDLRI